MNPYESDRMRELPIRRKAISDRLRKTMFQMRHTGIDFRRQILWKKIFR